MRLENKTLGFVINFLLGVAWASMLIGAVTSFLSFYQNSFFFAVISALVGALPGLIAVLFLEHIITNKEQYSELKKQTKLLEKLLAQKEEND
jgi:RsiW-degrading membrane proteinase PrsW (M82 family)